MTYRCSNCNNEMEKRIDLTYTIYLCHTCRIGIEPKEIENFIKGFEDPREPLQ